MCNVRFSLKRSLFCQKICIFIPLEQRICFHMLPGSFMDSYDFYATVASVLALLPFCQKALIYRMLQRRKVCPTITSIFAQDIWSSFWLIVGDLFLPSWPGPFIPEYKPDRQLKESSKLCQAFSISKLLGALWFQKHSKPYKLSHILVLIYVLPQFDYRNQQTVSSDFVACFILFYFFVLTMQWVIKKTSVCLPKLCSINLHGHTWAPVEF